MPPNTVGKWDIPISPSPPEKGGSVSPQKQFKLSRFRSLRKKKRRKKNSLHFSRDRLRKHAYNERISVLDTVIVYGANQIRYYLRLGQGPFRVARHLLSVGFHEEPSSNFFFFSRPCLEMFSRLVVDNVVEQVAHNYVAKNSCRPLPIYNLNAMTVVFYRGVFKKP